jgi:quercetin dioxygenase-like cupin family protein
VRIDPLFPAEAPSRMAGNLVTFEPGARTAWHTHPLGQTLIVVQGCGWAQREGGPREEIHPGDVVRFEPGEKHWHGATATTGMSHIAIQRRWTEVLCIGWSRSQTTIISHREQATGEHKSIFAESRKLGQAVSAPHHPPKHSLIS